MGFESRTALSGDSTSHLQDIFSTCLTIWTCTSALALLGAVLAGLVAWALYQFYFHPLAQYPGPLLGRLTPLYDLYHAYIGDKHILFYHLHAKYGPVVRFSPNSLSINDPEALKILYSQKANASKGEFYKCFRVAPQAVSTLLATDKAQHARKRRVMGLAFSEGAMRGIEGYVLGHVEELIEKIEREVQKSKGEHGWSKAVDMASWCNWLVFDIMGDLVFGRSFGTLGAKPENRTGIYLLGRAARRNYVVAAMPSLLYTGLEKVLPILRGLYLDRCQYLAFGKRQVMERTKEGFEEKGRKDIFSFLLHAKDPETGEGLSMPELWMEGNTLIVAGSDTTSTTLAATLYYLITNPDCLRTLQQEIRSTFNSSSEIRMGTQMQSCTYLRACIDETMRMTPAVGGLLPREILTGGLEIPSLDLSIPAGVNVGVPIYAIQHHEEYIPSPFKFDPTRWLSNSSSIAHAQDKESLAAVFNPFSLGHRGCLGKPLVYMELCCAIARLVLEYEMREAREQSVSSEFERDMASGKRRRGEYHLLDWFMSRNEGPWVEFRRREGAV